ncbi:MAG: hypothetical protein ACYCZY_09820 [Lacisediminihabitans sp.]
MTRKDIRDLDWDNVEYVEDEDVIYQGAPLTAERIAKIVEKAHAIRDANLQPGGKSLTAPGEHSPTIQFRVPREIRQIVETRAAEEGISLSKLGRRALEEYIAKRA